MQMGKPPLFMRNTMFEFWFARKPGCPTTWRKWSHSEHCAKLAEERGYHEINLNVGCPSDRVQNGMFGALAIAKADLVAECIAEIQRVVNLLWPWKRVLALMIWIAMNFSATLSKKSIAGCQEFIVHARKAWLSGLSPKENREDSPLDYDRVYQLKKRLPAVDHCN